MWRAERGDGFQFFGAKDLRGVMRGIESQEAELREEERKYNASVEAAGRSSTRSVDEERERVQREIERLERRRDELDAVRKGKGGR